MLTNNFYNFLRSTMLKFDYYNNNVSSEVSGLVDITGAACPINTSDRSNASQITDGANNQKIFYNNNISLGTGKTPPTLTDYELAEKCNNLNLSATRIISRELSAENVKILWTITGINSNDKAVTITELGLYKSLTRVSYSSGNGVINTILLARTLLPNPITVQPQENFLINYEVVI